jgi:hypothetical protein
MFSASTSRGNVVRYSNLWVPVIRPWSLTWGSALVLRLSWMIRGVPNGEGDPRTQVRRVDRLGGVIDEYALVQ